MINAQLCRGLFIFSSLLAFALVAKVALAAEGKQPVVTRLVLIDANKDQDISELRDGAKIALSELPSRALNVRAEVDGSVQKIRFQLNTHKRFREETAAPYSLAGDVSGDYRAWHPRVGENLIVATPIVQGKEGQAYRVVFTVSESKMLSAHESADASAQGPDAVRARMKAPEVLAEMPASSPEESGAAPVEVQSEAEDQIPSEAVVTPSAQLQLENIEKEAQIAPPPQLLSSAAANDREASRQVFFLEPIDSKVPRDAIARGECTVIKESSPASLKIVCTHTLEKPFAADLRQAFTSTESKQICSLGAPRSPVVGHCILTQESAPLLNNGKLYVAISTEQGGLRGWLPR